MSAVPQIDDLPSVDSKETSFERHYADSVNPQWMRLLKLLEMNVRYNRCIGAELFTVDGQRILDLLSGYCVHNLGHNHPAIIEAVKDEVDRAALQCCRATSRSEPVNWLTGFAGLEVAASRKCSFAAQVVRVLKRLSNLRVPIRDEKGSCVLRALFMA